MLVLTLDDPRWAKFVATCPDALPFHHPAWSALLGDCYGLRPLVCGLADADGRLRAGLPILEVARPLAARRWVGLPFTDYCPILTRRDESEAPTDFGERLSAAARAHSVAAVEVHAALQPGPGVYPVVRGVRHTLALSPDPQAIFRTFSAMHRRNISKSEQSGLEVRFGTTRADVEVFYRLHVRTRRRLGVPVQPRRFFRLLTRRFIEGGLGFVASVRQDGHPIAAAVFLHSPGTLVYKYGASDPRFWRVRPNNLLFWSVIQWACEHNIGTFDWGRTDLADQGLRTFKSGWGAREELLLYTQLVRQPMVSRQPGLRATLALVIQHSPPWVCQVLGELLYRYTA